MENMDKTVIACPNCMTDVVAFVRGVSTSTFGKIPNVKIIIKLNVCSVLTFDRMQLFNYMIII